MNPLVLLLLASLALFVGPISGALGQGSRKVGALVDGFALILVSGLCLGLVLPHVLGEIGPLGGVLAAAGVALPSVGHRLGRGRLWSIGPLLLVLGGHVALDGAILSIRGEDAPLAWAVVAHRLPVGFALVVAVQASGRSIGVAAALALAMAAITAGGYLAGASLIGWLPEGGPAGLEALVAGVLLHVVFAPHVVPRPVGSSPHPTGSGHHHHHHHHHGCSADEDDDCAHQAAERTPESLNPWAAVGAIGGLLGWIGAATQGGDAGFSGHHTIFVETLGVLVLESAPALLLGYTLAGIVPFLLTPTTIASLARGGKLAQSLRGVAFGLPLPVCSCGVLPLYESLIRRGAPPAAAMAFFVATPELGLDALLLSVPLLGPSLTFARLVAAFGVAILVALLLGGASRRVVVPRTASTSDAGSSWVARLHDGLRFGFVEVFDHTMPWIAVGLVVAAMAEPMLSDGALAAIPQGLQVPLAGLIGVPMYVCASGATPVAAIALHKGMSAGAALAFLISGPATNVTTFGVLARLHGRRTAALFGLSVTALAIIAGWTVDAFGVSAIPVLDPHAPRPHGSWFAWTCVGFLAALTLSSLLRQGPRGALRQIFDPIHSH